MHEMRVTTRVMSSMKVLKIVLLVALSLAILSVCISGELSRFTGVRALVGFVEYFVPSIKRVSLNALDADRYALVLSSQWIFVPIYTFIMFFKYSPLSMNVRNRMIKSVRVTNRPNRFWLLIGISVLLLDIFGSFGIISSPSLYNGGYIIDKNSPISHAFYSSNVILVIYAWASCITEVLYFWLLSLFIIHWQAFFGSIDKWRGRQLRSINETGSPLRRRGQ